MSKKKIQVICIILVAVVLLCVIPIPISYSATLDAVKLDGNGNTVGTVQVPLKYTVNRSLFSHSLKKVAIPAFDGFCGYSDINITDRAKAPFNDYWSVCVAVGNTYGVDLNDLKPGSLENLQGEGFRCILRVTEDCQQWMISIQSDEDTEYHYAASLDESHSANELFEFFTASPFTSQG